MKNAKFAPIILLALTFALVGCQSAGTSTADVSQIQPATETSSTSSPPAMTDVARQRGGSAKEMEPQKVSLTQAEQSQNAPAQTARKIIRNANLTLEVNEPEDTGRKIASIAESKSGFVISSDARATSGANNSQQTTVTMVLRVPAQQFDQTLAEIRQLAPRVVQEKVSGQDVTEEFIDLEARINTKRALETQFLEIMKQAKSVEDALEVQRQLAEVRGEIESLEGRRKFLENQTSLSTINITLQMPAIFAATSTGFGAEVWGALSDGINAALWVVLALIRIFLALLPLVILFGIPLYFLIRYLLRKSKRQKLAEQLAQEETV